jgi:hypothetical protein
MRRPPPAVPLLLALLATAAPVSPALAFGGAVEVVGQEGARKREGAPAPEVLGVRLGMGRAAARARLATLGVLEREERKRQEVWRLRDRRFSHLLVGFDARGTVRYATAVARTKGAPVAYASVGPVAAAVTTELPGHRQLQWEGALEGGRYLVVVHGRGERALDTWSVKRVDVPEARAAAAPAPTPLLTP